MAAGELRSSETASNQAAESLSQFVARVLNQLSLSAWLPAAALVLVLMFVLKLGTALDASSAPNSPGQAISDALNSMAGTHFGGAVVLAALIVVLTVLTQAFAFEAIRTLEGYWGTSHLVEWIAQKRCRHYRRKATRIDAKIQSLNGRAWLSARAQIERAQDEAVQTGDTDTEVCEWSPDMLRFLGATLLRQEPPLKLGKGQRLRALAIPWQSYASPDLLRRLVNLDKRARDFPRPSRVLPTRLGNVLRAHEDLTGRSPVETLVLEVYDDLPPTLRTLHDEHRNRLDLYCTMIFVLAVGTVVAIFRFSPDHQTYAASAAAVGAVSCVLSYRAAIASARIYGLLIVNIAQRFPVTSRPQSP